MTNKQYENKYNQEEFLIKNGERFTILIKEEDKQEKEIPHEDRCDPKDIEFGKRIGREIAGLDLNNENDRKIYYEKLEKFIEKSEDIKYKSYPDSEKLITIGLGYNMDKGGKKGSRSEWNQIFGEEYRKKYGKGPDFDEAYSGNISLKDHEIKALTLFSVKNTEQRIKGIYGEKIWNDSSPAERLLMTDMAFGGNKLIAKHNKKGEATEFYKHYMSYIQDRNICSFSGIHWEIIARSNPPKDKKVGGVQKRNCRRIGVLQAIKEYHNLTNKSLPKHVIPGKTYIPRDMPGNPVKDSPYFIYRTMRDTKVRKTCAAREGRIYRHDDPDNQPKSDWGCRCEKECLTEEVFKRINVKAEYFEGEANANIKHSKYFVKEGEVVIMTNLDHDIELLKSQINLSHYALINEKTEMIGDNDNIPYQMVKYRKFQVIERDLNFILK